MLQSEISLHPVEDESNIEIFKNIESQRIPVTGDITNRKTLNGAKWKDVNEFKVSNRWLKYLLKIYSVKFQVQTGT